MRLQKIKEIIGTIIGYKKDEVSNKAWEPVLIRLLRPKSKKAAMQINDWPQDKIDELYLKDLEAYVEELEKTQSYLYIRSKRVEKEFNFRVKCYQIGIILMLANILYILWL